jgi:hypothetical protein
LYTINIETTLTFKGVNFKNLSFDYPPAQKNSSGMAPVPKKPLAQNVEHGEQN